MHERINSGRNVTLASIVDIDFIRATEKDTLERISEEYSERHVFKGDEGLKVGSRIVNTQATEGAIGLMTSWSTDADWVNTKGIVESLALTFPDQKIVFIETPGMGDSDKLTNERRASITGTGSFASMADQIFPAINSGGIVLHIIVGVSEGDRIAIALAEKIALKNRTKPIVVGLDGPGTNNQSVFTFARRFMLNEQLAQGKVIKNSPDRTMADAHKAIDSKLLFKKGIYTAATKRNLAARAQSMAKAGLAIDVKSATKAGVEIFDYRFTSSTFADESKAEELASITPGYNVITLPKAPHGINEGNPFAVSQLVKQALTLKASFESKDESVEAAKRIIANN
jgi:pimeloyl-ACP methyl ester carboxylesterase